MSIEWIIYLLSMVVNGCGLFWMLKDNVVDDPSQANIALTLFVSISCTFIPLLNTVVALLLIVTAILDVITEKISKEIKSSKISKKKTPQKSKQSPTEELQVSDDNLIEKVLRSSNISSSNIVYAIVNKLKSASKSKYYCASLIGSVKSLFLDAIRDAYDVTPYELRLKPHVVASELQSTMIEISKALDIQIHWIKDMEAKEKQLDYIDYSARENKRLDIIRSMTDDFITMNKIENADKVKDYTDPYGGIFQ